MGSKSKVRGSATKVVGSLAVTEMSKEFEVKFEDVRLTRRAQKLGTALSDKPHLSLPKLLDSAGLEGAYRLLNHDDVHWRALHEPHHVQTLLRCTTADAPVLIIHDTTECTLARYSSERMRDGMVSASSRTQGMLLHASIAVSGGDVPVPLGTLRTRPFVHAKHANAAGDETVAFWQTRARWLMPRPTPRSVSRGASSRPVEPPCVSNDAAQARSPPPPAAMTPPRSPRPSRM